LDKPGIVAGVTDVLYGLGCNIEDSSMTILERHFAVILIVSAPDTVNARQLEAALQPLQVSLGVRLFASEIPAPEGLPIRDAGGQGVIITVSGHDRTGITHRVSEELAATGVNITDLNARIIQGDGGPVYIMLVEAIVPAGVQREALQASLDVLADALGVEIRMRDLEPVTL